MPGSGGSLRRINWKMHMTIESNELVIWQVAAGDADRPYTDLFLKHSVALIGPGDAGKWSPSRSDSEFEGSYVRRFAEEVNIGDVLLLRKGIRTVCAVDRVASEYEYLPQFDDVNGWDLQHCRRVYWFHCEPHVFGGRVFGSRLSRVYTAKVVDFVKFFTAERSDWRSGTLKELPTEEKALDVDAIPSHLNLREIIRQAPKYSNLYWNRNSFGNTPTENEMIAHWVVPFLRALGWEIKNIAVEWTHKNYRIDVCVFCHLPRVKCHYLIEVKRLGAGLEGAREQGKAYAMGFDPPCDIVVTDGIRYRMYEAQKNFELAVSANLSRLKQSSLKLFERMKIPNPRRT